MSGVPTVTTSSSVFSTFITSSHLIFWEAEKYPSLFRLENGKKQGAKRKILQIFFARRLYLRFDTWNYTLFFALSVSRWKYTFRSKTDTFRYWKYTKSEKPSIYGYRRYTLALQLKYSRTGDQGGSPSGSAANARSRALWVPPCSVAVMAGPEYPVRSIFFALVYSSTRHSAKFTFDYVVCLKFIDVFDIISIWIGLIITDLP